MSGEPTITRHYLECLAQASFVVELDGLAVVVDPRRDVGDLLAAHATSRVKAVLLTHIHADFVAGHMELASRTGAPVLVGRNAGSTHPHMPVVTGDRVALSSRWAFEARETPGHTLGCVTWVLLDCGDGSTAPRPTHAFTGDTLFVGSCGRPDLLGALGSSADDLARHMRRSLRSLAALPEHVAVLPAHGAGSPCGKSLAGKNESTIGDELRTNQSLRSAIDDSVSDAQFVRELTADLPDAPPYFADVVAANLSGAFAHDTDAVAHDAAVTPAQFAELWRGSSGDGSDSVLVVDGRMPAAHCAQYVPGSVNVPLGASPDAGKTVWVGDGQFAIWAGTLLAGKRIALRGVVIVPPPGRAHEMMTRLDRVLPDVTRVVRGVLAAHDVAAACAAAGVKAASSVQRRPVDVPSLDAATQVLDTRTHGEFVCPKVGRCSRASSMPLFHLSQVAWPPVAGALPDLARDARYVVYCQEGFRSSIATSLLRAAGVDAEDVVGGWEAMKRAMA